MAPKRKGNKSTWTRNVKSRITNARHAYKADEMGKHTSCRKGCLQHISYERAQQLCDELNLVPVKATQDTLLLAGIQTSPKSHHASYSLRNERGERIRVCQKFWAAVYGVGATRSRHLLQLVASGANRAEEARGKHTTRSNQLPPETLEAVRKFLDALPAETTHYLRDKYPYRRYISSDYTISGLHTAYLKSSDGMRLHQIQLTKFKECFHQAQLHIGFPRVDTCTVCDQEQKHECSPDCQVCRDAKDHHEKVKATTDARRADEEMAATCDHQVTISIDLMKSLQFPRLTNEKMYYLRKLSAYVFGIHNFKDNSAEMFYWSENIGKRGSDEIGTCVYQYLSNFSPDITSISI